MSRDSVFASNLGRSLEIQTIISWIGFPTTKSFSAATTTKQFFPNLFTIRGTRYRDFENWTDSLGSLSK